MLSQTLILEIGVAVALVALVGWFANRFRFSVIPFFILIGMVLGQHAPQIGSIDLSFTESKPFIDFMGRLGVLFLLFYLGLDFSVGRLMMPMPAYRPMVAIREMVWLLGRYRLANPQHVPEFSKGA